MWDGCRLCDLPWPCGLREPLSTAGLDWSLGALASEASDKIDNDLPCPLLGDGALGQNAAAPRPGGSVTGCGSERDALGCDADGAKAELCRDWRLAPAGSLLEVACVAEAVVILDGGRDAAFLTVMMHSTSSPAKTMEFLNWMDTRMFEGRLII
jgi:hypothetical protein